MILSIWHSKQLASSKTWHNTHLFMVNITKKKLLVKRKLQKANHKDSSTNLINHGNKPHTVQTQIFVNTRTLLDGVDKVVNRYTFILMTAFQWHYILAHHYFLHLNSHSDDVFLRSVYVHMCVWVSMCVAKHVWCIINIIMLTHDWFTVSWQ